jgi:hypothetical protein
MSRINIPHSYAIANLTSLLTLRTDPPGKFISKGRPKTTRILTQLHIHTVHWLYLFLLVCHIKARQTARITNRPPSSN